MRGTQGGTRRFDQLGHHRLLRVAHRLGLLHRPGGEGVEVMYGLVQILGSLPDPCLMGFGYHSQGLEFAAQGLCGNEAGL